MNTYTDSNTFVDGLVPPIDQVSVDTPEFCQLYCSDIIAGCQLWSFNHRAGDRANCMLYDLDPATFAQQCNINGGGRKDDPSICSNPSTESPCSVSIEMFLFLPIHPA